MDFHYTPEEEAFRSEVRAFIAKHNPKADEREDPDALAKWHAALMEKKWIGFSWPREAGGGGGSVIQQFILKEEIGAAQAPPLGSDFMGLTWVGPALINHGSEAQKQQRSAEQHGMHASNEAAPERRPDELQTVSSKIRAEAEQPRAGRA